MTWLAERPLPRTLDGWSAAVGAGEIPVSQLCLPQADSGVGVAPWGLLLPPGKRARACNRSLPPPPRLETCTSVRVWLRGRGAGTSARFLTGGRGELLSLEVRECGGEALRVE